MEEPCILTLEELCHVLKVTQLLQFLLRLKYDCPVEPSRHDEVREGRGVTVLSPGSLAWMTFHDFRTEPMTEFSQDVGSDSPFALHELAPRERGKPPHAAGTLCQELYNMLKSVGILENPDHSQLLPQGARQHAELWAWPLVWRNTKKSRITGPGAAPESICRKKADFLSWWKPQRDEGRLVSKEDWTSYDRAWTVCHVLCSDFMIQSSQCSCKASPLYPWGNWGPERVNHLSGGRLLSPGAWLQGTHTWVLVKTTQLLWTEMHVPIAFSRPCFQVTSHTCPPPPELPVLPPTQITLSHPTHTNTDSHSP